ncbi:MAG: phosphoribosylaminoimidazolesuccinocarboxamide synthase [candidate division KSB1 bacterium]|nr:phosphoribosylaminoimidazolesuccinocarboxamide synthase [candidate division KSB1 bacterium]MDQ7066054.1 phosphoribosylaminoimidazolesuccinocarboxamide synthase [candidate division KSB1 bacterium]
MRKKKKLYEGKAKILYETEDSNYLIQEFKDDASAFNGVKKGKIANKGYVNNQVSAHLFRYLNSYYVPNHFVDLHSDRAMVVRRLQMFPIEVVVRNIAAGSLLKRSKYKEGEVLPKPLVEFFLKDDAKGDPQITEDDILKDELASKEELEYIKRMALKINAVLKSFFERRGIKLVDFKLEFGKDKDGKILLADEISPDTCRFWDVQSGEKLDKDRFRFDLGNVEEAYEEIRRRVFLEEVVTE